MNCYRCNSEMRAYPAVELRANHPDLVVGIPDNEIVRMCLRPGCNTVDRTAALVHASREDTRRLLGCYYDPTA
jgi:hypothetical protein